jgi:hypothetical protein
MQKMRDGLPFFASDLLERVAKALFWLWFL